MVDADFFNNLTSNLTPFLKNEISVSFLHYFSQILVNVIAYLYVLVKFFKVLCYSKMTFEWLPVINPYIWPFSMFHVLTGPYFRFWSKILPTVKFEKSSLEVSGIIALEALNSCTFFLVKLTNMLIAVLEQTEKSIL
jgi:hypothetical protein